MKNVFIINGHQYYPFAEGKLNQTLVDTAARHLQRPLLMQHKPFRHALLTESLAVYDGFLEDRGRHEEIVSYRQLDLRARTIAACWIDPRAWSL